MGKGDVTRQGILARAFRRASRLGLEGLTIGGLADEMEMSKSGLFAHFQAKEGLQLAVADYAAGLFVERVIKPTLKTARGEPRLRALFQHWLAWDAEFAQEGGCFFVAASFELDDRPGPVRDRIVQLQRDFLELAANVVATAVAEGHFRADVSPAQLAFEIYGVMLVTQHSQRLLGDAQAGRRAWTAFESLVARARDGAAPASAGAPRKPGSKPASPSRRPRRTARI